MQNFLDNLDVPPIIPPPTPERARTLILCFDGTGDQFDEDNSNVVQFFKLLKKDDRSQQMVYYQAGIGTYTDPRAATPFTNKIAKALDEAVAWYLDHHVMEGYEFLMQNYAHGDKICLFGFSRGAYTARALAGMLHKVGLLPPCNHQQVPFAYTMFKRRDETGWEQSKAFKRAFSMDVIVEFIGVWDTVQSVGFLGKKLPFTASNKAVRCFRHALALDERRAKFQPSTFRSPTAHEQQIIDDPTQTKIRQKMAIHHDDTWLEEPTDVKEVWFAGAHCDVGGGSVKNGTPHALARIPLRWMIKETFKCNTGILYQTHHFDEIGLNPHSVWPKVIDTPTSSAFVYRPLSEETRLRNRRTSSSFNGSTNTNTDTDVDGDSGIQFATFRRSPSAEVLTSSPNGERSITPYGFKRPPSPLQGHMDEAEIERLDAVSQIFDQLSLNWTWWILELLPMRIGYENPIDDEPDWSYFSWIKWLKPRLWTVNLGYGRVVKRKHEPFYIHRSVKTRMELTGYRPSAIFSEEPIWVD